MSRLLGLLLALQMPAAAAQCVSSDVWHKRGDEAKTCWWVGRKADTRCGARGEAPDGSALDAYDACPAQCDPACADAAKDSPWASNHGYPDVSNIVTPETTVEWLETGKVNLLVDVRTRQEFVGEGGTDVPACEEGGDACILGHARLGPYVAGATWTAQLAMAKPSLAVVFAESLATATDEEFEAALGSDLTGQVIGFMCHDGVNPNDPNSLPRSLISAQRAAALGARAFTVAGGMAGWVQSGFLAEHGQPTALNARVATA